MTKDDIFATKQSQIVDFVFDEQVVAVFPDMIRRSAPGYETVIPMTGLMAARHLNDGDCAYDLSCSLGATSLAILQQTSLRNITVIGVDNAPAMIEQAQVQLTDPRARFECADLTEFAVTDAKVLVLNFVMQFLAPAARLPLLKDCARKCAVIAYDRVRKTHQSDPHLQEFYDSTHLAWKRANGYSATEVSQNVNP